MLPAKAYQTPNAIDPGEAPPSRPWRVVPANAAEQVRTNAARLLEEAERPSARSERNLRAFVYDSDDATVIHDQLPSVDEARLYAGRILNSSPKLETVRLTDQMSHRTETIRFDTQRQRSSKRYWLLVVAFIVLVSIILGIAVGASKNKSKASSAEAAFAGSTTSAPSAPVGLITSAPSTPTSTTTSSATYSTRLSDTMEFFVQNGVSTPDDFNNEGTPQFLAALFLANTDALAMGIPQSIGTEEGLNFLHRYILTVFYYSLDGPSWNDQLKFLTPTHHCNWANKVTLTTGAEYAVGASCNEYSQVDSILIPEKRLRGTLPKELSFMTTLDFLDIKRNSIVGSIPDSFQKLTKLNFFDLRFNFLTGTLPDWFGSALSKLTVCALTGNELSGEIPNSLGQATLLKTLALEGNRFHGAMQIINALSNLEYLYLDDNMLSGHMDDTFLANLGALVNLDISGNLLTGNLPAHLFQRKSLTILDVHENQIGGSIPEFVAENTALSFLSLYQNSLTGSVPASIENLKSLAHLDLTSNKLNGTITQAIGSLQNLTYLFLSSNGFIPAAIPNYDFFSGLTKLRELSLGQAHRFGEIPNWLGNLSSLILLDLSSNHLAGTIPETLWELTNLRYLLLNRNRFVGTISSKVSQLTDLTMFLLDKNNFIGNLKDFCSKSSSINFLSADCAPGSVEVTCPCCKLCCQDRNKTCNDDILFANFDPSWEHNYTRISYSFSPNILYETNAGN